MRPDWNREKRARGEHAPGKRLLAAIRSFQSAQGRGPLRYLRRKFAILRWRVWSAITSADIPLDVKIGGGLLLPHPTGVVFHPDAELGPNCLILQGVVLGVGGPKEGAPRLEGHVDIGAGAKILGGVVIGAHAKIGANAVVLCDVPAGATAVGVPARILPPREQRVPELASVDTVPLLKTKFGGPGVVAPPA